MVMLNKIRQKMKKTKFIQHTSEWWWAYFILALLASIARSKLAYIIEENLYYGSPWCAIPIVGSWLLVIVIWIPMIVMLCHLDDD